MDEGNGRRFPPRSISFVHFPLPALPVERPVQFPASARTRVVTTESTTPAIYADTTAACPNATISVADARSAHDSPRAWIAGSHILAPR